MTHARNELAEALATLEDDPLQTDGFPHIRLSPERAQAYSERLQALVEDVLLETPDPDGEVYGIVVGMFKSPAYMQGPSTSLPSESSVNDEGSDS